ncbi:MAG: energy transducer TonB [Alphaproteobacteria bacterium]
MRLKILAQISLFLLCAFNAGSIADEELPAVRTLPCITPCANSTPAVGLTQPLPPYPHEFLVSNETYVEGYVRLLFKIKTDGHVSDISVLSTVGPQVFADVTVKAVKDWIYKPATLNGKAVETCRNFVMTFTMQGFGRGGRPAIAQAYRDAIESVKGEKWDDAQAILTTASSIPKLNLYERGMLANLASLISLKKADYFEAHRISTVALSYTSGELPLSVRRSLLKTRIQSALMLSDIVDAQEARDRLKSLGGVDDDDPVMKAVEEVKSKADAMPLFAASAKIPEVSDGQNTFIGLYRRTFAFRDIKGSLSDFTLACKQQAVESKITDTAEWHVPKSWSDCRVAVHGAQGTTFKLVQATD